MSHKKNDKMVDLIKTTLWSTLINFIILLNVNGQNIHTVTLEDQILVTPYKYTIKFNCVSSNILNKSWMKGENYISKDSVIQILNNIKNIEIKNSPTDSTKNSISQYLDTLYVEANSIIAYQTLKKTIGSKVPFNVEEYHINDFEEYEKNLIQRMLKNAESEVKKQGIEIDELVDFEEIPASKETVEDNNRENANGGFRALKEKFIEAHYNGHLINDSGQIVLKKKLNVNFKIK